MLFSRPKQRHPRNVQYTQDWRSAEASAARQRALAAHARGERRLHKIAKEARRSESQTSQYLSDAGLSCNDPVPANAAVAATAVTGDDLIENLSEMGAPPSPPEDSTPFHLYDDVREALGWGRNGLRQEVTFTRSPELVFPSLSEQDDSAPDCTAGASQVGTFETWWGGELPVLLVHHSDGHGSHRYLNKYEPDSWEGKLTGWWFTVPESVSEQPVGIVVAGTLREAAEAVLGVVQKDTNSWKPPASHDIWNWENGDTLTRGLRNKSAGTDYDVSRCRFSREISRWGKLIHSETGNHVYAQWNENVDTLTWETRLPEPKYANLCYGLRRRTGLEDQRFSAYQHAVKKLGRPPEVAPASSS